MTVDCFEDEPTKHSNQESRIHISDMWLAARLTPLVADSFENSAKHEGEFIILGNVYNAALQATLVSLLYRLCMKFTVYIYILYNIYIYIYIYILIKYI